MLGCNEVYPSLVQTRMNFSFYPSASISHNHGQSFEASGTELYIFGYFQDIEK
jgi:hypothetical protein